MPSPTALIAAAAIALIAAAPPPHMLPARTLTCDLGRIVNFDAAKLQTSADLKVQGHSRFVLFLPAIAARTRPPEDAIDRAEPVDSRTRIVEDSGGLTAGFPARFDRVVDLWPQRVELATTIDDPLVNTIVISAIDAAAGTASLFMSRATDIATYDTQHMFTGKCTVR